MPLQESRCNSIYANYHSHHNNTDIHFLKIQKLQYRREANLRILKENDGQ